MNFYVNVTETDQPYSTHPGNYIEVDELDSFIFSQGNDTVKDGNPIPSEEELNEAFTIIPDEGSSQIQKIFLADESANLLREIKLAGANSQYVFLCNFTENTQWEPTFELWDSVEYDSYDYQILGSGTPNNSAIEGVITTSVLPGIDWVGKKLAGGLDINRLLLNEGAGKIITPTACYFNLKAYIKSTFNSAYENPVFLIKYFQAIT